jgi:hypothetical protein
LTEKHLEEQKIHHHGFVWARSWLWYNTTISSHAILEFDSDTVSDGCLSHLVCYCYWYCRSCLHIGGHINPALTFAFVLLGDTNPFAMGNTKQGKAKNAKIEGRPMLEAREGQC